MGLGLEVKKKLSKTTYVTIEPGIFGISEINIGTPDIV